MNCVCLLLLNKVKDPYGFSLTPKMKMFFIPYITEYIALMDFEGNTAAIFINNFLLIIYQYDFLGIFI